MTRQTSIDAYYTILDNGLLGLRQWQVYTHLYYNGPCTGKQVTNALRDGKKNCGAYTTRLSELRDMGVIYEVEETICEDSGQVVMLWDVTGELPVKHRKIKSKLAVAKESIAVLVKALESAVNELEQDGHSRDERVHDLIAKHRKGVPKQLLRRRAGLFTMPEDLARQALIVMQTDLGYSKESPPAADALVRHRLLWEYALDINKGIIPEEEN